MTKLEDASDDIDKEVGVVSDDNAEGETDSRDVDNVEMVTADSDGVDDMDAELFTSEFDEDSENRVSLDVLLISAVELKVLEPDDRLILEDVSRFCFSVLDAEV